MSNFDPKGTGAADASFAADGNTGAPGAGAGGPEMEAYTPTRRGPSSGTLFLAGAIAIAGGLIYAMRVIGVGSRSGAAALAFDPTLLDVATKPSRDHRAVLEDLNASRVVFQVGFDEVQRNPFRMNRAEPTDPGDTSGAARAEAERLRNQSLAQRQKAIEMKLNGMAINSIIGGSNPIARISGKTVRVGDHFAEVFIVKAINARSVELEADGMVYTLSITRADGAPAKSNEQAPETVAAFGVTPAINH